MSSTAASPFTHDAVYARIKSIYHERDSEEVSGRLSTWFKRAPRYTTVRVNYPKDVQEALKELQEIVDGIYEERKQVPPTVYVHHTLKDLLIVPSPDVPDPEIISENEIIVDIHCGAAVLRGADVFAPGVLGTPHNLQEGDVVSVYADITGKCLRGFKKDFNEPKVFLGNGVSEVSRFDLFVDFFPYRSGVAVWMRSTIGNCPPLGNYLLDGMFLQNLPSVLCSHVLKPGATDCVLDMCAAPGGKTTHIASIMQDRGVVIALDRSEPRTEKLKSNIKSSGYTNVHAFKYDATKALALSKSSADSDESPLNHKSIPSPPYPPEFFDCIMLDAPCSALGQRPQLGNQMTESQFLAFPKLQKKLMSVAVGLLKPGGKLVYSTCSLSLEENEEVVSWALEKYPEIQLDIQEPRLGGPGRTASGLDFEQLEKLQRFDIFSPRQAEDCDTIGFFIAKFIKQPKTLTK